MRWLRWLLRILTGVGILIILLWIGIAIYVNLNKKEVLKTVTTQLNDQINGTLTLEGMDINLVQGFPNISVSLKNVVLHDSLWATHKKDLLKAKEIFVSVDAWSILKRSPKIATININNAVVYLFTDSNGYSNTNIFQKKQDTTSSKNAMSIKRIRLNKVTFVFENNTKFKMFRLDIDKFGAVFDYTATGWNADISINSIARDFTFNTAKGSYIKNKKLEGSFGMSYNTGKKTLSIPVHQLTIGTDDIDIGGEFVFTHTPSTFTLHINAQNIEYANAIALLSPNISSKLNKLDFKEPIDIQASIAGNMKFRDTPLVRVNWQVKDNLFRTPGGDIDCSFAGSFMNEHQPGTGMGHNDRNSRITISKFAGNWQSIPFTADTVTITNLVSPVLEGRFTSKFPVTKLNPIIGGNTFHLDDGTAQLNLFYKGGVNNNDTTPPYVYGQVSISNASMTYVPRSMAFTNVAATLNLTGSDLLFQHITLKKGSTVLNMEGSIKNFMNLYYTAPDKIVFDWRVSSPSINLNEFRSLLDQRKETVTVTAQPAAKTSRVSYQLDQLLYKSSVHMLLQVAKINYRKFTASDINAEMMMDPKGIALNNVKLKHAGGSFLLNGTITQQGTINNVALKSSINDVNMRDFFYAFENFGQQTLTDKNINGTLSANMNVTGVIKTNGELQPNSFNGDADFELKGGTLKNFEPLAKISKFIFRNRNLDDISFATIKNRFDIKGDKFTIYPMLIESSAINISMEGIYALGPGTNIKIDIPLRNPKKDEVILDDSARLERSMKGLVLHLRAVDGDDNKVKIRWNRKSDSNDANTDAEDTGERKRKRKRK